MTTLDPTALLLAATLYFAAFYAMARLGERGRHSPRWLNHPLVYVLSLGVIISTWSFYSAFMSAASRGFGYSAYYLGYGIAFLFASTLIQPIMRLTRARQLSSLADVFAFRFHSPLAGTLTTLALLFCVLPLLALQYLAVAASTQLLAPEVPAPWSAGLFCALMILFTLRFGTRDVTGRERNAGIVAGIAFETLFKLLVLLAAGAFAVYGVFGGFAELDAWLRAQPAELTRLDLPFLADNANLLILMFFAAAIAMPHIFHMLFHENRIPQHLPSASWGVPLFLLLASLPVLPLFWARAYLGDTHPVQYAGLVVGLLRQQPWLSLLFYTGGLAAATGLCIVLALSVSNMCMNHLLLRLQHPPSGANLYAWLLRRRRLLISSILVAAYLTYVFALLPSNRILDAGFVSFIACLQFLPGILALLYWPSANSKGFIGGLCTGLALWILLALIPLLGGPVLFALSYKHDGGLDWPLISSLSLLGNLTMLLLLSLGTTTSAAERRAARQCQSDHISQAPTGPLNLKSPADFVTSLTPSLGRDIATREVTQALADLGLDFDEQRTHHLQQLRSQVENNLCALFGPSIAHQVIERYVPYSAHQPGPSGLGLSMIESQLETWPGSLSGLTLDLDTLRRHHRQILLELPIGVCSVDSSGVINLWNHAMRDITTLAASELVGLPLNALPPPWRTLLEEFLDQEGSNSQRHLIQINGRERYFNLHKAITQINAEAAAPEQARPSNTRPNNPKPNNPKPNNTRPSNDSSRVILLEDLTDTRVLEAELAHAERLSSVGRLAAGMAHEIGNPVTGIACLAQNLRDEINDAELREMAEQIIQQTRRITSIMGALISFSHSGRQGGQPPRQEAVDLCHLTEETLKLLQLQSDGKDLRILNQCHSAAKVRGDAQRIQQVLLNLLTNARDASPPGSTIRVTNSSNDKTVTLTVTDQGAGIPKALQTRIFEPFFTTKDPGKGTGLGLPLVYNIIADLGGAIHIESPVDTLSDTGTRVIVTLPKYEGPAAPTP
ncbi:MAG: PAS domain-containing protein [Pseudomonadales bacterium]|jgi:signal transduction histidine kinase/Na+/proline symporter|nr:PAS domain-containing protein [Pseudomonadales bacterium]